VRPAEGDDNREKLTVLPVACGQALAQFVQASRQARRFALTWLGW